MAQSEEVVKKYLINEKNYTEDEVKHSPNTTPDFICPDKEFEAKKLYGNKLIFYDTQIEDIEEDTVIVVTNLEKVLAEFKWAAREKPSFDIEIVESTSGIGDANLRVSKQLAEKIRENYEGRNDEERLENLMDKKSEENVNKDTSLDLESIRSVIRSELENLEIDRRTGQVNLTQ